MPVPHRAKPPPPQNWPIGHEPQSIEPPQPSLFMPQVRPSAKHVSGMHDPPSTPPSPTPHLLYPPPPQNSPPAQLPQSSWPPQPSLFIPQFTPRSAHDLGTQVAVASLRSVGASYACPEASSVVAPIDASGGAPASKTLLVAELPQEIRARPPDPTIPKKPILKANVRMVQRPSAASRSGPRCVSRLVCGFRARRANGVVTGIHRANWGSAPSSRPAPQGSLVAAGERSRRVSSAPHAEHRDPESARVMDAVGRP